MDGLSEWFDYLWPEKNPNDLVACVLKVQSVNNTSKILGSCVTPVLDTCENNDHTVIIN